MVVTSLRSVAEIEEQEEPAHEVEAIGIAFMAWYNMWMLYIFHSQFRVFEDVSILDLKNIWADSYQPNLPHVVRQ